ncbi:MULTISPECIES: 5-(carboxyamino)imidazole ribonucleotide mutase [Thermodesulfovibrio]|jgi:5-(carboxyamino)imidazole ribonucleotide mutase|uniref:N5-carboxyaminoimidazole ribonucleotide mutase n=2 Tax=Thermodesulfovibrio yellowstonii TaxID=28262 RepID=B5YKM9_THEYD|nr:MULTISPECIES: 5-(carboxyamino)imidazole ribonucleotide mutase [Thermodesulfovibrio]ACI20259.1 phosphoribosylaminoimidazole carboxylase, catalytic subunit [Thermodesulfovibrio yellowstonii DSM 11347]GLI53513.1 N5-carboxyaminoimidazole ribonucleotide mutase [Thermodesulfovibrio islandicus]
MAKVLILMGSDSDYDIMKKAVKVFKEMDISFEIDICSAHRTPDRAKKYAEEAEEKGIEVIIAAAGMAAHLAGFIAAHTVIPVIGVPVASGALNGFDALLSTVQMPPGIPVATVGINGAENAAYLACEILSLKYPEIRERVKLKRKEMYDKVLEKSEKIRKDLTNI